MISLEVAQELKDAGLSWEPELHDTFAIPFPGLEDRRFVFADLTVDVTALAGLATITFGGSAEWSLDYVFRSDAVWLPNDSQLVELLGDRFQVMVRLDDGYRCSVKVDDQVSFEAANPSDAYGLALVTILRQEADLGD
ncbi:MAG: hypothetical protein GEU79_08445 [Acidimicrobiia bacterium]|nr:hypothetical protein [Acidimicrobiia bacterium]